MISEDDNAIFSITPASADLSLEKTISNSTPNVGSQVTFTWAIHTLANAAFATLDIMVTVDSVGEETNAAEITSSSQFDVDSTPNNDVVGEDDQTSLLIRAPPSLCKRLFLSR